MLPHVRIRIKTSPPEAPTVESTNSFTLSLECLSTMDSSDHQIGSFSAQEQREKVSKKTRERQSLPCRRDSRAGRRAIDKAKRQRPGQTGSSNEQRQACLQRRDGC